MTTPAAAASWQVRRIVVGSPAWNPQATLALVTAAIMAVSSPRVHLPNDSPTSLFRSIVAVFVSVIRDVLQRWAESRGYGAAATPTALRCGISSAEFTEHGTDRRIVQRFFDSI